MWPFKEKSTDHAFTELVESLSTALGKTLLGVFIFGSEASGETREGHSNVNVFILLETVSKETLGQMTASIASWTKWGPRHPLPVFLPVGELQAYAENLPIEFLDMQDHHKVLYGTADPLRNLIVDRRHLRAQCAQELSVKLLKLRQAVVLLSGESKALRAVLVESLPSILTLFRAALRLETAVPKGNKLEAAKELARRVGFDAAILDRLWQLHLRRESDNLPDLAWQYLQGVSQVLSYVNKR